MSVNYSGASRPPVVSIEIVLNRGFGGIPGVTWQVRGGPNNRCPASQPKTCPRLDHVVPGKERSDPVLPGCLLSASPPGSKGAGQERLEAWHEGVSQGDFVQSSKGWTSLALAEVASHF